MIVPYSNRIDDFWIGLQVAPLKVRFHVANQHTDSLIRQESLNRGKCPSPAFRPDFPFILYMFSLAKTWFPGSLQKFPLEKEILKDPQGMTPRESSSRKQGGALCCASAKRCPTKACSKPRAHLRGTRIQAPATNVDVQQPMLTTISSISDIYIYIYRRVCMSCTILWGRRSTKRKLFNSLQL